MQLLSAKAIKKLLPIFLLPISIFAAPNADSYCTERGGRIIDRQVLGISFEICFWMEAHICGHDGVCLRMSECEKWDHYQQKCKEGMCEQITFSRNEKGDIMRNCLPATWQP